MNYLSIDDLQGATYKEIYNTVLDLYSNEIDNCDFIRLYAELKEYNVINSDIMRAYKDILQFTIEDGLIDIIDAAIFAYGDQLKYQFDKQFDGAFDGIKFNQHVDLIHQCPAGLLKGVEFNNGLSIQSKLLLYKSLYGIKLNGGDIDLTEVEIISGHSFSDIHTTKQNTSIYLKNLKTFVSASFECKHARQDNVRIYYMGTMADFENIILNTLQYIETTRSHFGAVHSFRYLIKNPMYNIICYDGCYDFRKLAYDSKFMYYSIV